MKTIKSNFSKAKVVKRRTRTNKPINVIRYDIGKFGCIGGCVIGDEIFNHFNTIVELLPAWSDKWKTWINKTDNSLSLDDIINLYEC